MGGAGRGGMRQACRAVPHQPEVLQLWYGATKHDARQVSCFRHIGASCFRHIGAPACKCLPKHSHSNPQKYRAKQPHVFCTGSGRCPTCRGRTAKAATGGLPEARASHGVHASGSGLLCRGAAGPCQRQRRQQEGWAPKVPGGSSVLPDITDNRPHCIHRLSAVQGSRVAHAAGEECEHNKWARAQAITV